MMKPSAALAALVLAAAAHGGEFSEAQPPSPRTPMRPRPAVTLGPPSASHQYAQLPRSRRLH